MNKKILIVDDSPSMRAVIKSVVTSLGYEALEAEFCETGITVAREQKPDLIIMDIVMPEGRMDGLQAARTLSRDPEINMIPVIMCSTKDRAADKVYGGQWSRAYVTKPIDKRELAAAIKVLLP